MSIFKKKKEEPSPKRTYQMGGYWGNAINWSDPSEFSSPRTHFSVVGWKPDIPKVNDYVLANMKSGKVARFQFTKVTMAGSPSDMFFGTVAFIGYEGE